MAVAIFRLYLPPLGEKPCIKIKKTVQIFKVKSLDFSLTKQFLAFYRKDWGREQRLPDTSIFSYVHIRQIIFAARKSVGDAMCLMVRSCIKKVGGRSQRPPVPLVPTPMYDIQKCEAVLIWLIYKPSSHLKQNCLHEISLFVLALVSCTKKESQASS